jgi:hypothetical protein
VFHLPPEAPGARWKMLVDSSDDADKHMGGTRDAGTEMPTQARSMLLLVFQPGAADAAKSEA